MAAEDEGKQGSSKGWGPARELGLRDMWTRGFTASQIADQLGGTGRNAVIGKAHRLGLKSRPSGNDPTEEEARFLFIDGVQDPIREAIGSSVRAREITELKWSGGTPYLGQDLQAAIEQAAAFAEPNGQDLINCEQLILAALIFHSQKARHPLDGYLQIIEDRLRRWKDVERKVSEAGNEILRWDAVDVIATAANLRSRLYPAPAPIEMPLLLLAYLLSPTGQRALKSVGLADDNLEPFRGFAIAILDRYAGEMFPKDSVEVLRMVFDEVQNLSGISLPRLQRAGFENDAVSLERTDPAIQRDARALADLILLEAAAPPLAIGVFGSWGSGKSTLLGALQHEIDQQTAQERRLMEAGRSDENPATRRMAGVLQIELNAWTFADSDNLWASLTSDIFDQIAAGGKDAAKAQVGTKLVAEVIEKGVQRKEQLQEAVARVEATADRMKAAERKVETAERDRRASVATAVAQVALELLGPEKAEKDEKSGKDEGADTKPAADKSDEKSLANLFWRVALLDDKASAEDQIRRYAEAGGRAASGLLMAKDFVRRLGWVRLLFALLFFAAAASAAYFGLDYLLAGAAGWIPTLSALGVSALTLFIYALPVVRAFGMVTAKVRETKASAEDQLLKARAERDQIAREQVSADEELERKKKDSQRLMTADNETPSAGLLLSYLLEESVEIAQLRGSLGTLGTVRRAFQKLNAVLLEHGKDRTSKVQRIVIYIDDLDRCPPKHVVKILEAIHLLLAFPCFVVVAAVDARWLETALSEEHKQLASGQGIVTAADYLEKIFQIAYWVRPLQLDPLANDGGTYGRMISALAGRTEEDQSIDIEVETETDDAPPVDPNGGTIVGLEPIDPRKPAQIVADDRARVEFSQREVNLFNELGPLAARSPRAVKRMINIYRILRANSGEHDEQIFIIGPDGEHVPAFAVQFALACEAGFPSQVMADLALAVQNSNVAEWANWERLLEDEQAHYDGRLRSAIKDQARFHAFVVAYIAAQDALGGMLTQDTLVAAFAITGRYSFRRPGADAAAGPAQTPVASIAG